MYVISAIHVSAGTQTFFIGGHSLVMPSKTVDGPQSTSHTLQRMGCMTTGQYYGFSDRCSGQKFMLWVLHMHVSGLLVSKKEREKRREKG